MAFLPHRLAALLALAGALTACGAPGELSTDRSAYPAGATVELTLRNGSAHRMGFNLCFARLLRLEADGRRTGVPTGREGTACKAVLLSLGAGGEARETVALREDVPAGVYVFEHQVELESLLPGRGASEKVLLETAPFAVERR
jgi:hypothetical protein